MVEPSKSYAEWNKPIIKDHWQVSIYLKCQEQEKLCKKEISESGEGETGERSALWFYEC